MKINWAYLKKPSVLIGAVVLFFILLFLLNKGGGASAGTSGTTVVNSGPSDAQVAASTQLALAQLSAGVQNNALSIDYAKSQDANDTQLALAQVAAALQTQNLTVQQNIANETIAANVHGMDLQYQGLVNQNATALAQAQAQYNYGLASQAVNANLQQNLATISANTTVTLSQQQLQAYEFGTLASTIPTLKSGKRDNAFALLTTATYGTDPNTAAAIMAPNGGSGQSGGFSVVNVISPVTSLL